MHMQPVKTVFCRGALVACRSACVAEPQSALSSMGSAPTESQNQHLHALLCIVPVKTVLGTQVLYVRICCTQVCLCGRAPLHPEYHGQCTDRVKTTIFTHFSASPCVLLRGGEGSTQCTLMHWYCGWCICCTQVRLCGQTQLHPEQHEQCNNREPKPTAFPLNFLHHHPVC